MEKCVCGSGKNLEECCKSFVIGGKNPSTPEELMRSRYYAFTTQNVDYLLSTHDPDTVGTIAKEDLLEWAKDSKWISLKIIATESGTESDSTGTVEFTAIYEVDNETHSHHEKSLFVKKDGKWYYNSEIPIDQTIKKGEKIGRNDPCPCGSGKKYKKCCGK